MYKKIMKGCLSLLYPTSCPICHRIVMPKGKLICKDCKEQLDYIEEPRCKKCSKPIESETEEYCYDCMKHSFHYTYGYAIWSYDDVIQQSMASFKYKNQKEYASFYIEEAILRYREQLIQMKIDVIVPIPIHPARRKQRGYNQAELLARGIAGKLQIAYEDELLFRKKKTKPQNGLNDRERFQNLKDAFGVNLDKIDRYRGKKILLVDDIYTTGSTIELCTKQLLLAGVKETYFFCLCIGKGY